LKLERTALIAEIIGSAAIVITLIVLIFQIRGNTEEMRAATLADLAARTQEIPLAAVMNPQWAGLLARMQAGEELTSSEQMQHFLYLVVVLKLAEEAYIAYDDGRLDDETWLTRAALALNTFDSENNRERWAYIRTLETFVPRFVSWFDAALSDRYGK